MQIIRPDWQDRLDRMLESRARESVFADVSKFPRRIPRIPTKGTAPGKRGVYHRIGVDGSVSFDIVDSDGNTRFEIKPSARDCHQRTLRWCERVLDAIDPRPPQHRPPLSVI